MKKFVLAITVLTLAASSVFAGSGLGLFGTYWDGKDADDAIVGGGIKFKMELAPNICLELRGSYLVGDSEKSDEESMIPVEADLIIEFPIIPDRLTLYVGGGGGYYIFPEAEFEDEFGTYDLDSDDEFGFFGIGGAELKLNESTSLFAEAKYTAVKIEGGEVDGVDMDDDHDLTGLGANAGLLVMW